MRFADTYIWYTVIQSDAYTLESLMHDENEQQQKMVQIPVKCMCTISNWFEYNGSTDKGERCVYQQRECMT